MSENRFWFVIDKGKLEYVQDNVTNEKITVSELEDLLNEQQELIEELQVSDENNDHPCFACARNGEGGATYDFPHPAVKCIVDNHRSLDILGDLRICLDGLYKECPKNNGGLMND